MSSPFDRKASEKSDGMVMPIQMTMTSHINSNSSSLVGHQISNIIDPKYSKLVSNVSGEILAALSASVIVAPAVGIIDRAISVNASKMDTMNNALRDGFFHMIRRPFNFARQPYVVIIWGVFMGTYAVANVVESVCKYNQIKPEYPKFFITSGTNIFLSVRKDHLYTQMFSPHGKMKPPVPWGAFALFGIRDGMTMVTSFIMPKHISNFVQSQTNAVTPAVSLYLSQLIAPVAVQALSTPLNLYGIHMANHPISDVPHRLRFIRQEYLKTLGARMGRILPAFGIGGVVNVKLRSIFTEDYY